MVLVEQPTISAAAACETHSVMSEVMPARVVYKPALLASFTRAFKPSAFR